MKKRIKMLSILTLCISIILLSANLIYAENTDNPSSITQEQEIVLFKDVPQDYWAYNQIKTIWERKIIGGFGDGTYRPDAAVTRAQFSKMMVLTLEKELKNPTKPTFIDIKRESSSFQFIETAKYYLTGYKTPKGNLFKPDSQAVREDMAVALVKALGYENEIVDESVFNQYADVGAISPNLKKYVAIAIKHGLMQGSNLGSDGVKAFKPQDTLTRASTAVLLCNIIKEVEEEKVTFDEDTEDVKYTEEDVVSEDDPQDYTKPVISSKIENGILMLKWNKINDERLQGYKVVISKSNPYPSYPNDGYLYWITDKNKVSVVVNGKEAYKGGDFGKYLVPGQSYYFSITAVYDDIKLSANTLKLTYPITEERWNDTPEYSKPLVSATTYDGKIKLKWTKASGENFHYYKVVISKSNANPKYPEDGYLYYFTDPNTTSSLINPEDSYNGGDFEGKLISGQTYYFSVTSVYGDRKVPGNTLRIKLP